MKLYIAKIIFILASVASFFVVGGCKPEKKYRIGVSQCSRDDWRSKMNEEIEREILMHPEAEVEIRSADDSNEKQIEDIRYFASNGFDIIVAAPNEAEAITPVISEVYNKGIPVVIFDRGINGSSYTSYQGSDNFSMGSNAARYAAHLLRGRGKILEIKGLQGSTPAAGRHEGFSDALNAYPDMKIVGSADGHWNYDVAARKVDSLLNLYPDVDLVYAHNDRMAIAASDITRRRGDKPYIIGIDAAPGIGMKAVKDGVIDATFLYPTDGHRLVRTALAILKGEPYERNVKLPIPSAVDRSNVDILLLQDDALKEETAKMKDLKSQIDIYWERHSAQTFLFYAAIAILCLLAGLFFVTLRSFWQYKRYKETLEAKNSLLAEQHQKQKELNVQLEQATHSKLVFFTNVSHDLRTPLNLISEPVAQIVDAPNLTPGQHTLMKLADKNVRILKRLINQILDFRTYENGKMNVNLTEVDFKALCEEWVDSFRSVARKRNIKLLVEFVEDADMKMAIDVEKVERVVYNLLSNAFKYTPENGSVSFKAYVDNNELHFIVKDSGPGIGDADKQQIFERFYQIDKVHPKGSGIGLSLVKAFVDVLGGRISVESEIGNGAAFEVILPVKHVEKSQIANQPEINRTDIERELEEVENDCHNFESGREIVLVVDDNEDVRVLLTELLSDSYNVITAENGMEGMRKAMKYTPDVVVCDVMMPGIDGMECCKRLKGEIATSHIPVLLLTACTMDEHRSRGYESGADSYLGKPFDSNTLKARIANLIANRKLIKGLWGKPGRRDEGDISKPIGDSEKEALQKDAEDEFYSKFLALAEKSLSDPDLSVDTLAAQLGLGRSQFYRKIKAITNYSPVELIRNLRLKRARHLLTTTSLSVSEIGYQVGFSTPAYFTKCYREAFGETPTEFRNKFS